MHRKHALIIRVAGEGGEGIISIGDFLSAACARAGLEVYTYKTFPVEIKGGYAVYSVRTSAAPSTTRATPSTPLTPSIHRPAELITPS